LRFLRAFPRRIEIANSTRNQIFEASISENWSLFASSLSTVSEFLLSYPKKWTPFDKMTRYWSFSQVSFANLSHRFPNGLVEEKRGKAIHEEEEEEMMTWRRVRDSSMVSSQPLLRMWSQKWRHSSTRGVTMPLHLREKLSQVRGA
jgi:hypothetical protein